MTKNPSNRDLSGRGAQNNPPNRFINEVRETSITGRITNDDNLSKTRYLETHAKTIVNEVKSPDISLDFSVNPYQGCEHGCSYCYARNTHNYWGYSAGLDFESVILVKKNAPLLLEEQLNLKSWKGDPIMLSGNTDCYQPIERKLEITRQLLKLLLRYKNPVGLITKNSLVLRDLDLLVPLSELRLLKCSVSLNTLDEEIRRKLEPRASSILSRLKLIERLSSAGIPVNVMVAPVIPGINHHEIHSIMEEVSLLGALDAKYIVVRLNGDVRSVFKEWLKEYFPDRYSKVLNQIAELHGGHLNDSRFSKRMKGEGVISQMIHQQYQIAKRQFFSDRKMPEFDTTLFKLQRNPQLSLFKK